MTMNSTDIRPGHRSGTRNPAFGALDLRVAPVDGPVAFGGDLSAPTLRAAYGHGLYPFPAATVEQQLVNELTYEPDVHAGRVRQLCGDGDPYSVAWLSPDPRPLIFCDGARLQRSLRQQLRNKVDWTTTVDSCFEQVVLACRVDRAVTWLTDELIASLCRLHADGDAHSVEVWDGDELVGGTFGVQTGAVVSADSQFTRRTGAGKVAVTELVRRFGEAGGVAVDVQRDSAHVRLLGARPVPRMDHLGLLRTPAAVRPLATEPLPARRLATSPADSGERHADQRA
jgi:leucyl/phenylalanyl-tRNA---protein transferase